MEDTTVKITIEATPQEAEDLLLGLTKLAEDGVIDGVKNVSVQPAEEDE